MNSIFLDANIIADWMLVKLSLNGVKKRNIESG